MNYTDYDKLEEELLAQEDSIIKNVALQLLKEAVFLKHELNNPWYMYAGSRISRAAIITRNCQIQKLLENNK